MASSDEDLRLVTHEVFDGWLAAATQRLEAGGLSRDRAAEVVTVLVAALEGGFLLSRVAKDSAPMELLGRTMAGIVEASLDERR